jgi:short-subunit dehydrogenase
MKQKCALVTGGTTKSGIGFSIATRLAEREYAIILVGRKIDAMKDVGQDLSDAGAPEVFFVTQDLAKPDASGNILQKVEDLMQEKDARVEVLINNAGLALEGDFLKNTEDEVRELLMVHVFNLTLLTWHFARKMRERGYGRIMNTASVLGFTPGPFNTLYAATKAFVISLSYALSWEMKWVHKVDVRITALCPGATESEMMRRAEYENSLLFNGLGFLVMKPEDFSETAVERMFRGHRIYVPGMHNKVLALIARHAPRPIPSWLAGWFLRNRS